MVTERYELAAARIEEILTEETVGRDWLLYFRRTAAFLRMIHELKEEVESGRYRVLSMEELEEWNRRLYLDVMPEQYENSFANPAYAVRLLGKEYGQILSFLYTEIRGSIVYAFERKTEYLAILYELFIEIYNCFEADEFPDVREIRNIIYWYASDYCDVFVADRIREQIDPECSFAVDLIRESSSGDLRYLYQFGEYVGENELQTARYLASLDESLIRKMAGVFTEGYRAGFVNTGKDLSKKSVVNIRYVLGFERVIKAVIENFENMGLAPVIYRAGVSVLTRAPQAKIGYYGGTPNRQYEYDHRNDRGLFLNKKFIERKLEVIRCVYEENRELALQFAGPAVMEVFGEAPFSPVQKEEAVRLSEKQEEIALLLDSKSGRLTNEYIPGEERSFTIAAYPIPEIGPDYPEIFKEVVRINMLDSERYGKVQQRLIDVLDRGEAVRILGRGNNRTDLTVRLCRLQDASRETIFENCTADVNIPVGEVFTTPVLEGTNGTLHVGKVYLDGLQYLDLELRFEDGMVADYRCGNFQDEAEGKRYVKENVLHGHESLPMGEFAIGTNTTAYAAARKYGIEDKMPILIAEKTGPHFAVGDTCYSWAEEIRVYNPNGKEIVAKDNSVSIRRRDDVSKAYFHCHTDITIPYEELGRIAAVMKSGEEIPLIEDGVFVLPGTEILNEPLKKPDK